MGRKGGRCVRMLQSNRHWNAGVRGILQIQDHAAFLNGSSRERIKERNMVPHLALCLWLLQYSSGAPAQSLSHV